MARPLRIEFAGAFYHITSRGDRREAIYEDDEDREAFLNVLAEVIARYNWICHAFCLMTNQSLPSSNRDLGRESVAGDASTEWCLHPGIESTPSSCRTFVPGAIQGNPGGQGSVPVGAEPVCRSESGSGGHGRVAGTVALEQLPGDGGKGCDSEVVGGGRSVESIGGRAGRSLPLLPELCARWRWTKHLARAAPANLSGR